MWASVFQLWQLATQWYSSVAIMLLTIAFCWPLERWKPRVVNKKLSAGRLIAITSLLLATTVLLQFYGWLGQPALITTFVKLKFFSLSKLPVPDWLLIVVSMMLLDFLYFLAHFISHYTPVLWRLHKIHHADEDVNAFSALLHHPLESLYVAFFITGLAVLLGMPVLVLVYFGLTLAAHAVISHADIALPASLDQKLRLIFVTPDVHRTHHSQNLAEGNSNFGAMFTIWDRLFGTYIDQPKEPLSQLSMGLSSSSKPAAFTAKELLLFPFRRQ